MVGNIKTPNKVAEGLVIEKIETENDQGKSNSPSLIPTYTHRKKESVLNIITKPLSLDKLKIERATKEEYKFIERRWKIELI